MDKKMKTNQDGGSVTAKDSSAAGKQLEKNQEGAAKMGYSQSFGAARVNGYAKGAAKVANIMSFGASKYMKHGAADTGHGGPEGHTHPTKTITSRNTSGGGSTSSSSNTTGGDNSSSSNSNSSTSTRTNFSSDPVERAKQKEWITNNPVKYKQMLAEKKNKNSSANVTTSSNSSNNTNAGSSTTTSNTITSPNSMAETLLQANIANENRAQTLNFDREEAQIAAGNDSIRKANQTLDKMPRFHQLTEAGQAAAGRAGGRAAATSRRNSNLFSREEINTMYRDGQNKQ